ncbi:two-component sensor histidine kinase [Lysinibacillus sp. PLM2]|nr:two-component sensor histidine kinase [Lysinibacillus sp. PLM2]
MKKLKNYFLNLSLKKKWTLSASLIIFISFACICVVIYFALYTWLYNNEQNNALRTVDDLSSFFNSQDGSITIHEFQENAGLMKSIINQNQTVRIFNLDGYEVLRINNESPAAQINVSYDELVKTYVTKVKVEGNDVIAISRVVHIGQFHGYMQLIHPLKSFQSMMQYVLTAMLIAGFGAILLAGLVSSYLSKLLLKPLGDLRDSMQSVKEKGFEERIKFTYQIDDEIGDLLKIYQSMIDELQVSFAKQQQFVSDASHELRTPIQAIEGHLSLIKRWGKSDPEIMEESLNTSIKEVQRMKKMIEELLDLARREEKDIEAIANIEKVLQSVQEELLIIYRDSEIQLNFIGDPKPVAITENALAQIIRNIIENGIRYNDKKPIIQVQVNFLTENTFLTIKDNGIGISQNNIQKIFDRFFRVDDSREAVGGGTGLGLSITKMLADKYDIEMDVSSEIGEGTTFILRFPN